MAGGPLDDFQTDLKSLQAFQVNFTPEPASLILVGLGVLVAGRRGRARSF
jgi:hypothetical protein